MSGTQITNPEGSSGYTAQGGQVVEEYVATAAVDEGDGVGLDNATTGVGAEPIATATGPDLGLALTSAADGEVFRVCRAGHAVYTNGTGGTHTAGTITGLGTGSIYLVTAADGAAGSAWVAGCM